MGLVTETPIRFGVAEAFVWRHIEWSQSPLTRCGFQAMGFQRMRGAVGDLELDVPGAQQRLIKVPTHPSAHRSMYRVFSGVYRLCELGFGERYTASRL
jgi:hypothetical protein